MVCVPVLQSEALTFVGRLCPHMQKGGQPMSGLQNSEGLYLRIWKLTSFGIFQYS